MTGSAFTDAERLEWVRLRLLAALEIRWVEKEEECWLAFLRSLAHCCEDTRSELEIEEV